MRHEHVDFSPMGRQSVALLAMVCAAVAACGPLEPIGDVLESEFRRCVEGRGCAPGPGTPFRAWPGADLEIATRRPSQGGESSPSPLVSVRLTARQGLVACPGPPPSRASIDGVALERLDEELSNGPCPWMVWRLPSDRWQDLDPDECFVEVADDDSGFTASAPSLLEEPSWVAEGGDFGPGETVRLVSSREGHLEFPRGTPDARLACEGERCPLALPAFFVFEENTVEVTLPADVPIGPAALSIEAHLIVPDHLLVCTSPGCSMSLEFAGSAAISIVERGPTPG